jgi:tRNA nucleotidyltransferase (CCA-adding enzyme)
MIDIGRAEPLRARRLLARYSAGLLFDLLDHKEADLRGKGQPAQEDLARLDRFREVVRREQSRPHRLADLAVGGDDLIALGYTPGPTIGQTLQTLLREVVDEPTLNTRDVLLERAKELAG